MPGSYRLSICAAVGLALLATSVAAQPVNQNRAARPNAAQRQNQARPNSAPAIPPAVQADRDRIAKALETANADQNAGAKEQREKDDLKAQQDMAGWAGVMAAVAGLEALITLTGVILVGFTLAATRNASREAKRAADAAEKAIVTTRDIGEAQTRAYVQITQARGAIVTHGAVTDYGTLCPCVTIEVSNTGRSPALAFRWSVQTVYLYDGSKAELRGAAGFAPPDWGHDIAPQRPFKTRLTILPSILNTEDAAAFRSGKLYMAATIRTVFLDVFGNEITSEDTFSQTFGADGQEIPLTRTPLSTAQMVEQAAFGRKIDALEKKAQSR
jgi:hypothetical protein